MPPSTIEYTGPKLRVQGSELPVGAANRDRNLPFGGRKHPNLARLDTKRRTVVDFLPGLSLPLMDHLMQQRVLHLRPVVVPDVTAADADFFWLSTFIHDQFTQ